VDVAADGLGGNPLGGGNGVQSSGREDGRKPTSVVMRIVI